MPEPSRSGLPARRRGPAIRAGAATLAVLALLVAAAPWLVGVRTEHAYEQFLADLSTRGYRIVSNDYDRGWTSARVETLIAPQEPPSEPVAAESPQLRIQGRIEHGPRAGIQSRWPPVLAVARGRVSVVGGPRRLPPLRLEAELALDGGLDARLSLPDVTYSGAAGQLRLIEIQGRAQLDRRRSRLQAHGQAKALEAVDADGRLLALRGLVWDLDLTDAGGLPAGEANLTLSTAELSDSGEAGDRTLPPFDAAGLHLRLSTRRERDLFGLTAVLALDHLVAQGTSLAPSRVGLALSGLDAVALAELREGRAELARRRLPEAFRGVAGARLLLDHLPALLADGPAASIAPLSLTTPQGPVDAELALSLRPAGTGDVPFGVVAPGWWLTRLDGKGWIELPRPLVLEFLEEQQRRRARDELVRRGEPADPLPPELAREVTAAGEAALVGLVRERWLVPAGMGEPRRLRVDIVITDGRLAINGRPVPLAVLGRP